MSEVKEVQVQPLKIVLQMYEDDIGQYHGEYSKNRLGKILTIIDGAIVDATQRKAVKDMINDMWYGASRPFQEFPQAWRVAEALGFELEHGDPPVTSSNNRYKELLKIK